MIAITKFLRLKVIASTLAVFHLASITAPAAPPPAPTGQPATKQFKPTKRQMRQLILDLQITAMKCDQKTVAISTEIFQLVSEFRARLKRFPKTDSELKRFSSRLAETHTNQAFPPRNPYADPSLVSKELRQELINAGTPPGEFCKIDISEDPYLSASFPLSLNNVKLHPEKDLPGTVVVKCNNDCLAVWCMGFTGKPILDAKTQQPVIFFKDFSTVSE